MLKANLSNNIRIDYILDYLISALVRLRMSGICNICVCLWEAHLIDYLETIKTILSSSFTVFKILLKIVVEDLINQVLFCTQRNLYRVSNSWTEAFWAFLFFVAHFINKHTYLCYQFMCS